jgi:hypothetical protein
MLISLVNYFLMCECVCNLGALKCFSLLFLVFGLVENLLIKWVFESEPLCFGCRSLIGKVKKLKFFLKSVDCVSIVGYDYQWFKGCYYGPPERFR